ncbi:hypothetical protein [Hymenobacter sp. B81]|uniref:hypothetical protein n=1 Tax=Hymenobacter sp. B81 TaxID=3344878 RepID=UPI0037DCE0A0
MPKPVRRNGKTYWEIYLYYDQKIGSALTLRQQEDTVWLAINPEMTEWAPDADSVKSRQIKQWIRQLHQEHPQWFPDAPASLEENVFLRFDARIGDKWACFARTRNGGLQYYWVSLDTVQGTPQQPLYVFSVSYSGRASHMSQLQKLVVSKTKGIQGMLWYDYACWLPYQCQDLLVRYGNWQY